MYAAYDLPDADPENQALPEQHLYSVRFEGPELWGPAAEVSTALYIDMWEGYLEPVDTTGAELSDT